jgi:hypothetical protein
LQLLDEKIRSAYLVATSGDLKRTDESIMEIEALGASTGQVRLLRGVVAYFRADIEGAIRELEQAVKLLPDSVSARALLAMACADNGQEDRYEQLSLEMQHLSPSSSEDYLFRGYARQVNEAGRGLEDVDEGIRRRDSPFGRALRAIVRAGRAIDSAKPEDAEAALADADVARGMLPDNQMVLYASVYARLVAAGIYQEAKLHLPGGQTTGEAQGRVGGGGERRPGAGAVHRAGQSGLDDLAILRRHRRARQSPGGRAPLARQVPREPGRLLLRRQPLPAGQVRRA